MPIISNNQLQRSPATTKQHTTLHDPDQDLTATRPTGNRHNRTTNNYDQDGRDLFRHAPAIDKVTQAQARAKLHTEYGMTFARAEETGLWEVEHLPRGAVDLFSKRHQQVTKVLDALGYTNATASAKEARVLTRASRGAKSEATAAADTTLRELWRAEAVAAGYDPATWMPAVLAGYQVGRATGTERANETMVARHGITLDDVVARVTHPETGLTAHTRRFSHLDAITAVADALPLGATVGEVEQLADLVLAHPRFVALPERAALVGGPGAHAQLAGSHEMTGGQLYTTKDVTDAERSILDAVAASHPGQGRAVVDGDTLGMAVGVTEAAQGYPLSVEQRRVLTALVTGGRAIESILGPAGAGKTTLMRAARVAWEAKGLVVAGTATAAVAAQQLAAHSGIESRTVAQWLVQVERGAGLAGVDVLVVDEANLTDDRAREALWAAAARAGVEQIVQIHDPTQLRGAGCGSMSSYIHAALDGPRLELTENRRQRSEDERAALTAWREGRYHDALQGWAGAGQVVATHTSEAGVAAMVSTWLQLAAGAPDPHTRVDGLLMIAKTNEQVTRINQAVQAVRAAERQLGEGRAFALPAGREVTFHIGDQVLYRRNDRHQQAVTGDPVLNGYRGVVTGITAEGVAVAWRQPGDTEQDQPHTGVCSPAYIAEGGLELGYALTTHKAEGMTVDGEWDRPDGTRNEGDVLVWTPGMDAGGGYVSLSRDRGRTYLFGSLEEVEGERERVLYGQPRDQAELTERVIAALAERAAATATCADDRPVLVDLGQAPAEPTPVQHTQHTQDEQQQPTVHPTGGGQDEKSTAEQGSAEQPTTEHRPPAEEMTDAQRQRCDQLVERYGQALRGGDLDALRAVEDELRAAFPAELGPHQVEGLREVAQAQLDTVLRWFQAPQPAPRDITDAQRQLWEQLNQQAGQAWLDGDPDAQQAADNAQRALAQELGAQRVEVLRQTEQTPARHDAAAQRRWEQLTERMLQARLDGDPDAQQAAEAQRRAYAEELGPERVNSLREEIWDREPRQGWRERPHGTVPDTDLEHTIARAERERAEHLAAVEKARTQLAETAPVVAEGRGPAVTRLDTTLAELRDLLELRTHADEVDRRWESTDTQARMVAAHARSKEIEGHGTRWYRPGLRDQRLAEATELQALAERAQAAAEDLGRQRDELHNQLPGGQHWHGSTQRTREQVQRAEAAYGYDLEAARRRDQAQLDELRHRISTRAGAADTTGQRRDAAIAEHQLRAEMPPDLARTENTQRTMWDLEQTMAEIAENRRAAEQQQQAIDRSRDYHYDHSRDLGQDRGFGLGL
jgi:hypothetical protein